MKEKKVLKIQMKISWTKKKQKIIQKKWKNWKKI